LALRRSAAITTKLALELVEWVERVRSEPCDRRVEPATRDHQQREARASLFVINANLTSLIERHVTRYQPTGDKTIRLHGQTAMIENGFVHIPETAPWLLLDREEQLGHSLVETPTVEICGAEIRARRADADARTEAQRGFKMLDRNVRLARPNPEEAADVPTAGVVRIQRRRMVNQCYLGSDILAEIGQREGGIGQDGRVVAGHFQGSPCEIRSFYCDHQAGHGRTFHEKVCVMSLEGIVSERITEVSCCPKHFVKRTC
jgi:hypothetical protein